MLTVVPDNKKNNNNKEKNERLDFSECARAGGQSKVPNFHR